MQPKDEISFAEVLKLWWKNRKLLIICSLCGLIAGLAIAFLWPKHYTAEVKLVAENESGDISSELQNIGMTLGVQIHNLRPQEYLAAELYPDIVASTPFLTELYQKSKIETLSTREKHNLFRKLRKNIDVFTDNKSGLTTVSVTSKNPLEASVTADSVIVKLERYIIDTRTQKARADHAFAEARFAEAKTAYYAAQEAYAHFLDVNRHLTSQAAAVERNRLENEQRLTHNIFSQLASQTELARIRVQEQTPVLTIIEPATVPVHHSSPRRKLVVFIGVLLGLAVPMIALTIRLYFKKNALVFNNKTEN